MPTSAPPTSLSVYRGQARTGIGEGPGKPIAHGEQYLRADPPLDRDGARLREIQPWMSLDADPADLDKAGDDLEAWSSFDSGDLRFVVRLVRAGVYDRRQAYFSHGRAWPVDACRGGFDPGAHLGRSQAFERPWRDGDAGERVPELHPEMVRPRDVAAEKRTAVRYLTHLLQARADSRPLIVAAPVGDFVRGGALHALVSFVRAALPSNLKDGCRVRVYTRNPELFLGHLGADLLVVPEAVAAAALAARRDATLLDRSGERSAGRDPDPRARAYADAVVERACKLPASLLKFSARFGASRSGVDLPTDEEIRTLQITYNLAFALDGPEERRGDLLRKYLMKKAGELGPLPWDRLIGPEEWQAFPRQAVLECLLRPVVEADPGRGPGGRALQRELEGAAGRFEWLVDPLLDDWWSPGDAAKARRLLELARHRPPLVSAPASAGRLLSSPEVCARLDDRFLLELGLEAGDDGLRRLYRELDRRMADPDRRLETTRASIERDWWPSWRRQTELSGEPIRAAALAWLECGAWSADGAPEAALEDWKQVIEDLGPQAIPGALMATLCDGGRPSWPWIPPFEGEQLKDLARSAADLGALAEIADTVAPAPVGLPEGTAVDRYVLEHSGQGDDLPPRALLWLSRRDSGERPPLALDAARRLEERCGHRRQEARAARVAAILAHLDRPEETRAALYAAAEPPSLWQEEDPAFLDGLARFLLRRGSLAALGEDNAAVIDRHLAAAPPPAAVPAEGLAGELAGRFDRAAAFLASRSATHRDDSSADRLIAALAEGDAGGFRGELLSALSRYQKSAVRGPHPLRAAAAEIRAGGLPADRRQALERTGWATFEEAARGEGSSFLAHVAPNRLPALDLALALSRPGTLGSAALAVAVAPASRGYRTQRDWWRALLRGLRDYRRFGKGRSLDDRSDVALALLARTAAALGPKEEDALDAALAQEAKGWPLISEFGVTVR